MQGAETKALEDKLDDENSGSAEFPGVKKESRLPLRIGADGVNYHAAPEHVSAGDRNGHRHDGHDAVHSVRICFGPLPRVHSAHRHSENGVKMFDAEASRRPGDVASPPCLHMHILEIWPSIHR